MKLHSLVQISKKRKKRLGMGHGSGRGKTAGRGTKGQKARGSIPLAFEGGALPLTKRLPFLRGKEKNKPTSVKPLIINVSDLESFSKGTKIDVKLLVEKGIVGKTALRQGVKVLGEGEITVALTVALSTSKAASLKIEKAGGKVETA